MNKNLKVVELVCRRGQLEIGWLVGKSIDIFSRLGFIDLDGGEHCVAMFQPKWHFGLKSFERVPKEEVCLSG